MVKTTQKLDLLWSAIFSVIVYCINLSMKNFLTTIIAPDNFDRLVHAHIFNSTVLQTRATNDRWQQFAKDEFLKARIITVK